MKDDLFWALAFMLWALTLLFFLFFLGVTNSGSSFFFAAVGAGFGIGAGYAVAKYLASINRP